MEQLPPQQNTNENIESCKNYIANLMTATSQVKSNPKGRRPALRMQKGDDFDEEAFDNELLEKALIDIGEGLNRKNSTMATEEDEHDDSDDSPLQVKDDEDDQ